MVSLPATGASSGSTMPPGTPPAHTMLGGVVKGVNSGDTLTLMSGGKRGGPPAELRVSLACIRAPLLAGREGVDEAHAWHARETLRRALIGKPVKFQIEYAAASRVYASVYVDGVNVAVKQVADGLAKVDVRGDHQTCPELDELMDAEKAAVNARVGLHGSTPSPTRRHTTHLPPADIATAYKGSTLRGIVEHVLNGSAMKVQLCGLKSNGTEFDQTVTVCLSGVLCPGFKREADSEKPKPMPFALNARYLTEIRLLHRDVEVHIEGIDRNEMLFASVTVPGSPLYVGEELLRNGFGKTVSWSLDLTPRAPALRTAERSARDRRLGVWKDFVAPKTTDERFTGKCIEVASGDTIVVLLESGETRRITLASVRMARTDKPSTRDRSIILMGPATDAKEALRKKLIGRVVDVKVEYTRAPGENSVRKDTMVFATVGRHGDNKNKDVALPMISDGLLSVTRHRGDEDRAENYEEYLEREKAAIEAKRGMHKTEPSLNNSIRVNNLTGPDAKKRSRDVLAGLQRNGPHEGIVEYVSNASRFRIYLPKQSMLITLALRAVRCPQSTRRSYNHDGTIREETKGEPHGDVAAMYAREHFNQRNVEVEIVAVDRVGAFLGNCYLISRTSTGGVKREDMSEALLELGHGYIHESFPVDRESSGSRYLRAQSAAKEAKRGLWLTYVEPTPTAGQEPKSDGKALRTFAARVCEVSFGGRVFVQPIETAEAELSEIANGLSSMNLDARPSATGVTAGQTVAAKFSADNSWYRAKVLRVTPDGTTSVRYIDYGNEDVVAGKDVRRLDNVAKFVNKRPVAIEVVLSDVVVPDADDPCGQAAGSYLRDAIFDRDMSVAVMANEPGGILRGDILVPSVATPGGTVPEPKSVVQEMLKVGLARLVRKSDPASKAAFKRLRPFEETGIATRQYLWHFGESYDSDADD